MSLDIRFWQLKSIPALTIVVLKSFVLSIKSLKVGAKYMFEHQDLQMFDLKLSHFQPLEVVDRGTNF